MSASEDSSSVDSAVTDKSGSYTFPYKLYYWGGATLSLPNDEFTIDTASQMDFTSQQRMKDGRWRKPTGLSYLETSELKPLIEVLRDTSLFSIKTTDVFPQCPEGTQIRLQVVRAEDSRFLDIQTNSCAVTYNLLFGSKKQSFKKLMGILDTIRVKYRPKFPEK